MKPYVGPDGAPVDWESCLLGGEQQKHNVVVPLCVSLLCWLKQGADAPYA
jgi:hypothetical protein